MYNILLLYSDQASISLVKRTPKNIEGKVAEDLEHEMLPGNQKTFPECP